MVVIESERRYESINPATGRVIARYGSASAQTIEDCLAAAQLAYCQWRAVPIEQRAEIALTIGKLFAGRAEELARLATDEMGKPLEEASEEVRFCASIFSYYGHHGPRLVADEPIETVSGDQAVIQKRPVGILLGIMPWNFPYYQVARLVAPNLVLGNTVLLKHAESVPGCADAIQELLVDAGVPFGVYQNMFTSHTQIERIIADPRVQGVSLTGSDRAGAAVAALAGKHLKKCVLELGGSDPYVVLDADDVPQAAAQAWRTRMYNTGQACNSNKRIIVMENLFETFVQTMTNLAKAIRPGDPMRLAEGQYAPMASRAAAENLAVIVDDAVSKGAQLHAGGELGPAPASYFSPAVLTGVTPQMRAYREELFGPVAVVYPVSSDDEALELANDTDFGLGAAVFSESPQRALEIATQLEVGMANVNTPAGEGAEIPFGGVKRSGFGRELGPLGMDEFVNKRLLYVKRAADDDGAYDTSR